MIKSAFYFRRHGGGIVRNIRLSSLLFKGKYYYPEMMDSLADFLIDNHLEINSDDFCAIFLPISVFGYQPKRREELIQACLAKYNNSSSFADPTFPLILLYNLATCLRTFPEAELKKFFTVDVMETLDRFVEGKHR